MRISRACAALWRASALGTFIMFADDTNIFVEGKTVEEAYAKGNELLKSVQKYILCIESASNMTKMFGFRFCPVSLSKIIHIRDPSWETSDVLLKIRFLEVVCSKG